MFFPLSYQPTKTNSSAVVKDCRLNSDMHFNLDNKEYLFTIIKKRRKRITKSESVLCSQTLSLFDFIYLVVECACLLEQSESTCIKTSTHLSAILNYSVFCFLCILVQLITPYVSLIKFIIGLISIASSNKFP